MKDNISYNNYSKNVKSFFKFLKTSKSYKELTLRSIKVKDKDDLLLVPISKIHLNDQNVIKKLCMWRNKNSNSFVQKGKTNFNKTKKWMKNNLLDIEDKILFLVVRDGKYPIGHIGLANCINKKMQFEIDNVIKGEKDENKKVFSVVLQELINWASQTFYVNNFFLRVLNNNNRAINFYKKNNFKFIKDKNKKSNDPYIMMSYKENRKNNKLILTAGPSISQKEVSYVNDAVSKGWNNNANDYLKKLEKQFSNYLNCKYAIPTSSCTGAMHIALMALGIKKGDEVILPNITWVATANAIAYVNATPIFADINFKDWGIDSNKIEKLITKKTKAIMPVHLYGQPCNMENIIKIAKKHNLHVIEDAAPAIGAKFKNKKCGTFGDFGAFSFQGAKLLVSGEGGMLVTNNKKLYLKALKISNQGRNYKKTFFIDNLGVKYKMSNIQAALALAQLERVEALIALKRRIFGWYSKYLNDLDSVSLNHETQDTKSIYWMSSIILNKKAKIKRDKLIKILLKNKIDSRPVFPELSSFKYWNKKNVNSLKNSKYLSKNAINLPSGVCLKEHQIQKVCKIIKANLT
tara:strand:+ start:1188 stop:2915 length:1728 start_codon:yes stop_codon:yes gene_type:complete